MRRSQVDWASLYNASMWWSGLDEGCCLGNEQAKPQPISSGDSICMAIGNFDKPANMHLC